MAKHKRNNRPRTADGKPLDNCDSRRSRGHIQPELVGPEPGTYWADGEAHRYHTTPGAARNQAELTHSAVVLADAVPLSSGSLVLDLGCGGGLSSLTFQALALASASASPSTSSGRHHIDKARQNGRTTNNTSEGTTPSQCPGAKKLEAGQMGKAQNNNASRLSTENHGSNGMDLQVRSGSEADGLEGIVVEGLITTSTTSSGRDEQKEDEGDEDDGAAQAQAQVQAHVAAAAAAAAASACVPFTIGLDASAAMMREPMNERALENLTVPSTSSNSDAPAVDVSDGLPFFKQRSDRILADMAQPLPFRRGTFDAVLSISAVQWLIDARTATATATSSSALPTEAAARGGGGGGGGGGAETPRTTTITPTGRTITPTGTSTGAPVAETRPAETATDASGQVSPCRQAVSQEAKVDEDKAATKAEAIPSKAKATSAKASAATTAAEATSKAKASTSAIDAEAITSEHASGGPPASEATQPQPRLKGLFDWLRFVSKPEAPMALQFYPPRGDLDFGARAVQTAAREANVEGTVYLDYPHKGAAKKWTFVGRAAVGREAAPLEPAWCALCWPVVAARCPMCPSPFSNWKNRTVVPAIKARLVQQHEDAALRLVRKGRRLTSSSCREAHKARGGSLTEEQIHSLIASELHPLHLQLAERLARALASDGCQNDESGESDEKKKSSNSNDKNSNGNSCNSNGCSGEVSPKAERPPDEQDEEEASFSQPKRPRLMEGPGDAAPRAIVEATPPSLPTKTELRRIVNERFDEVLRTLHTPPDVRWTLPVPPLGASGAATEEV